jgi:hypothetical protein
MLFDSFSKGPMKKKAYECIGDCNGIHTHKVKTVAATGEELAMFDSGWISTRSEPSALFLGVEWS